MPIYEFLLKSLPSVTNRMVYNNGYKNHTQLMMTNTAKALQPQVDQLSLECDCLRKKRQKSEEAYVLLVSQLQQMLRHRFGQQSERYVYLDNLQEIRAQLNQTRITSRVYDPPK